MIAKHIFECCQLGTSWSYVSLIFVSKQNWHLILIRKCPHCILFKGAIRHALLIIKTDVMCLSWPISATWARGVLWPISWSWPICATWATPGSVGDALYMQHGLLCSIKRLCFRSDNDILGYRVTLAAPRGCKVMKHQQGEEIGFIQRKGTYSIKMVNLNHLNNWSWVVLTLNNQSWEWKPSKIERCWHQLISGTIFFDFLSSLDHIISIHQISKIHQ